MFKRYSKNGGETPSFRDWSCVRARGGETIVSPTVPAAYPYTHLYSDLNKDIWERQWLNDSIAKNSTILSGLSR